MSDYTDAELKKAFDFVDTDHSGSIDTKELENVLLGLGLAADKASEAAKEILKEDDANKDGKLTFAEFKKGVEKECSAAK